MIFPVIGFIDTLASWVAMTQAKGRAGLVEKDSSPWANLGRGHGEQEANLEAMLSLLDSTLAHAEAGKFR